MLQCGVCQKLMKDNTKMMKHLIGHAYNEGSYTFSDSSPQCRYCLRDFLSDFALQSHVEEVCGRFVQVFYLVVGCKINNV